MKQLAHVCVFAKSLQETAKFYEEALGLTKTFQFWKDGDLFGYYLGVGRDTFIEVFKSRGGGEGTGAIHHFAIEVDDIDEAIARIERAGYHVKPKKMGVDRSWQAWTEDPNGVRIELQEYTARSSQRVGGDCEANW